MAVIKTVYIYPPLNGTGHHPWRYMSFFEGDELNDASVRGWGQTVREAEDAVVRNPLKENKIFDT